jgi:hypothetical protein
MNGSSTTPPGGQPAFMQSVIRASGNVAKWAPLNERVDTDHTERLLRDGPPFGSVRSTSSASPVCMVFKFILNSI